MMRNQRQNILLIGAPGSGKGTQALKLVSEYKLKHLSTGDLFRRHIKEGTSLGLLAKSYMDQGQLVPNQVTNDMVESFVKNTDINKGIVFDGFPRNLSQAQAFDQILKIHNRTLDKVLYLEISAEQIIERLTGRLYAPQSGRVYHIKNDPPQRPGFCDQSGETLVTRKDDNKELILSRLKVFHRETKPLLDYYKQKNLMNIILAELSPEEVYKNILKAV